MHVFRYHTSDLNLCSSTEHGSEFDSLLTRSWTSAMISGHFKYTLSDLESKILPGPHRFIVQLNTCRFEERRKPQPIQNINEPFDETKFNFTKVEQGEIMFTMSTDNLEALCIINVSPLEFGHSLLVPFVEKLNNQVLSQESVRLALHSLLLSRDPFVRLGFNSLCAHASVNHLHLHIWYLKHELFVQNMSATKLRGHVFELTEHATGGFGWELNDLKDLETIVDQVSKVAKCLMKREIAHNVFITRGRSFGGQAEAVRVLLWPRRSVTDLKTENDYNIAVAELAGQIPVRREQKFQAIDEEEIVGALAEIRLDHDLYVSVKRDVINIVTS